MLLLLVMYRCITIKDIQKNGPKTPVPPAALVRSRGTTELLESLQRRGLTRNASIGHLELLEIHTSERVS